MFLDLVNRLTVFLCFVDRIMSVTQAPTKVTIRAGGATLPLDVYTVWKPVYQAYRSKYAQLDLTYTGVGSGEGVNRLKSMEYDFAGSDAELSEKVQKEYPDFQMFPTMAVPVALAYNIPELSPAAGEYLNLTQLAVAGIFSGTVMYWNDSLLVEQNPKLQNVSRRITVVVRADESGTTELFTRGLAAFSDSWRSSYNFFKAGCDDGRPIKWNSTLKARCGHQTRGMTGVVLDLKYSIGYMGPSDARDANLPQARLQNAHGSWVSPVVDSVQAAMDATSTRLTAQLTCSLINAPGELSYPIAGYTYYVIRKTQMKNCTIAVELYRMFDYLLWDSLARSVTRDYLKAPLSETVLNQVRESVLMQMMCQGSKVFEMAELEASIENGTYGAWKLPTIISVVLILLIGMTFAAVFYYARYQQNRSALHNTFIIPYSLFEGSSKSTTSIKTVSTSHTSIYSDGSFAGFDGYVIKQSIGDDLMMVPLCGHLAPESLRWSTRLMFVRMREHISHGNVMKFVGLCSHSSKWTSVSCYPAKGRLRAILRTNKINLDNVFRYSIITDVAQGLFYLHKNNIVHGQLTSYSLYVDSRWNIVIGDWEQYSLHKAQTVPFTAFEKILNMTQSGTNQGVMQSHEYYKYLFWSSPESLSMTPAGYYVVSTPQKPCDVYSFGVIAYEIFGDLDPYDALLHAVDKKLYKSPSQILNDVLDGFRPCMYSELAMKFDRVGSLIWSTWDKSPDKRPSFGEVLKQIKQANPRQRSILDSMMIAVERYAASLEERIAERTKELEKSTKSLESLLNNMLPPSMAGKLAKGEPVEPELYEASSVFFSDIVGFTTIASMLSPLEVVQLLNDLYSAFDEVISSRDVYKVETIGDAYMCVSGVPTRNGSNHAPEICMMALDILNLILVASISNVLKKRVQIRIGINSGSLMAGIVGLKMPRYCLFGDTVNTASRMESSSLPMRIQVSEFTKCLLDSSLGFHLISRGLRNVKGKGSMNTYWLIGRDGYDRVLPGYNPADDEKLLSLLDENQIK